MWPLLPDADDPVLSSIEPDTPLPTTSAVLTLIEPEPDDALEPVTITIEPPSAAELVEPRLELGARPQPGQRP
jgi:hypothetical protein